MPDSNTYHWQSLPGYFYWIDMKVTITNRSDRSVYLHRHCGYGDAPERGILRVDDPKISNTISVGTPCEGWADRLPIELRPGATYEDGFRAMSVVQRHADPPPEATDERTGSFRLEYFPQMENRVEGWQAVALIPLEQRLSEIFDVLPP